MARALITFAWASDVLVHACVCVCVRAMCARVEKIELEMNV